MGDESVKKQPLTQTEKDWLAKLQALLDECPSSRLGAYTIGDPELSLYDRHFEPEINKVAFNIGLKIIEDSCWNDFINVEGLWHCLI